MNKVLLDTNVLLDIMLGDRPGAAAAAEFMDLIDSANITISVSAGSLKDIYYVACKYLEEKLVRDWIAFFMEEFAVVAVDKAVCELALNSSEPDFEDGIIRALAEVEGVDFVLTGDKTAFQNTRFRAVDTKTYLSMGS